MALTAPPAIQPRKKGHRDTCYRYLSIAFAAGFNFALAPSISFMTLTSFPPSSPRSVSTGQLAMTANLARATYK